MLGGLLHDLNWSIHQGLLHEVFLRDGITVGTWGLVIATGLLVLDGWNKGKEQRHRWQREDERDQRTRKEESERRSQHDTRQARREAPKYVFGIRVARAVQDELGNFSTLGRGAELWVANLGMFGLHVVRLHVKHREFGAFEMDVARFVPSNAEVTLPIPLPQFEKVPGMRSMSGNYLWGDHEIWLDFENVDGSFTSEPIIYTFHYQQHRFVELVRGSHEDRQLTCPKCGTTLNAIFPATGALTEREVKAGGWLQVQEDIRESCPNHTSPRLRWLENHVPPWIKA